MFKTFSIKDAVAQSEGIRKSKLKTRQDSTASCKTRFENCANLSFQEELTHDSQQRACLPPLEPKEVLTKHRWRKIGSKSVANADGTFQTHGLIVRHISRWRRIAPKEYTLGDAPLERLPVEILLAMISNVSVLDIKNLLLVSRTINAITSSNMPYILRHRADKERARLAGTISALSNIPPDLFEAVQTYAQNLHLPTKHNWPAPFWQGTFARLYAKTHDKSPEKITFLMSQLTRTYRMSRFYTTPSPVSATSLPEDLFGIIEYGHVLNLEDSLTPREKQRYVDELQTWKTESWQKMVDVFDPDTLVELFGRARYQDILDVFERKGTIRPDRGAVFCQAIRPWQISNITGDLSQLPLGMDFYLRTEDKGLRDRVVKLLLEERSIGESDTGLLLRTALLENLEIVHECFVPFIH